MEKEKKPTVEQIMLDEEEINKTDVTKVPVPIAHTEESENKEKAVTRLSEERDNLVNCLRNEKVNVRFIAKARGLVTDPRHVLYGGMAQGAKVQFTTPLLRSGIYADVLTKDEMKFLEYKLQLEPGALSVHKRENNFWSDANDKGIGRIELKKGDNPLDLSNPIDYIKYKILLANKDQVAPSMQVLQDKPKATYKFVLINEADTNKAANTKVNAKAQAYLEFGAIRDDKYKMRVIIETLDGRPTAANSSIEYLQGKIGELIEANTKMFLQIAKDPLLDNKVLIRKAIEAGLIASRGNYLYLKDGNLPLCESGQEPTLNVAAKYLSAPKQQELKFSLEAKVK